MTQGARKRSWEDVWSLPIGTGIRDRHLSERGGVYNYKRRVPSRLNAYDLRYPIIRISLSTRDLAQARTMRNTYEAAEDAYWASLLSGDPLEEATARLAAAQARAAAFGFTYRTAPEILRTESDGSIVARLMALEKAARGSPSVRASASRKC
ncbi:MAG: DUF6538 domain-containing protein [Rhizobium sp.]